MAIAMARLKCSSFICTVQFCHKNAELRSNQNGPLVVSHPTFAFSSSNSFSEGKHVEKRRHNSRGGPNSKWTFAFSSFNSLSEGKNVEKRRHSTRRSPNSKWRTRTGARTPTPVEEGVADAKRAIDEVLSRGGDGSGGFAEASWALYADKETKKLLEDAVTKLGACRGQDFGEFLRSVDGHGVWEVFHAPHIYGLSSAVRTQIMPLQYVLTDSGFSSHARYFSPLGEGWFSAAGDYVVRDGQTVEVLFDSFWADVGRDNLQPDPKGKGGIERTLVNLAGRGAFISALSVYPVYYADPDVTVFEFTALGTKIAAKKVRQAPFQLG